MNNIFLKQLICTGLATFLAGCVITQHYNIIQDCNYENMTGKEFVIRSEDFTNDWTYKPIAAWGSRIPKIRNGSHYVGMKGKLHHNRVYISGEGVQGSLNYQMATLENCEEIYISSNSYGQSRTLDELQKSGIDFTDTLNESESLNGKTVNESESLNGKTVNESGSLIGKTVNESGSLNGKTVNESESLIGKTINESDSLIGKTIWINNNNIYRNLNLATDNQNISYSLQHLEEVVIVGTKADNIDNILGEGPFCIIVKKNSGEKGYLKYNDIYFYKENPLDPTWTNEMVNKIKQRSVVVGMTNKQVIISWGKPDDIHKTVDSWGKHEQWVYSGGQNLYFKNGKLTYWKELE